MHLEQHVDEIASTLDRGRRRLAGVDLGDVVESTKATARAAAPDRWLRPKRRSRWPIVGLVLIIGTVGALIVFLRPTIERAIEERRLESDRDGQPNPADLTPTGAAYPPNPWGRTSEEKFNGEENAF